MEGKTRQYKEFAKRLLYFMNGDADAAMFCLDILFLGHLWDDLVDGDKERTKEEYDQGFKKMMGDIPVNPFYQKNIASLSPLMMSAILQWRDANILERGSADDRLVAFCIRGAFLGLLHYCLFLTGGDEWVSKCGTEFWREAWSNPAISEQYRAFEKEISNA